MSISFDSAVMLIFIVLFITTITVTVIEYKTDIEQDAINEELVKTSYLEAYSKFENDLIFLADMEQRRDGDIEYLNFVIDSLVTELTKDNETPSVGSKRADDDYILLEDLDR